MTLNIAAKTITTTDTEIDKSKPPRPSSLTQVLHHSHVTTDFDPHRFNAAAAQQLQTRTACQETSTYLIASPYNTAAHLLDISVLEQQDRLFALALTYLKPTHTDYATAPYTKSFNWTEVFELLKAFSAAENYLWKRRSYYVVIFRSVLLPDVDSDYLYALDAHSHREAMESGGLLKYWFGAKDELGRNLATCIWRNREDARKGGQGPWHARARAAGTKMYEQILFITLGLNIGDGVGSWDLSDWKENVV